MLAEGGEKTADDLGYAAADPRIDLVEDERRHRCLPGHEHLDRERDARQLAAGCDLREWGELLSRVRADPQLDGFHATRRWRFERLERHLETATRHREVLHRPRHLGGELLRR